MLPSPACLWYQWNFSTADAYGNDLFWIHRNLPLIAPYHSGSVFRGGTAPAAVQHFRAVRQNGRRLPAVGVDRVIRNGELYPGS